MLPFYICCIFTMCVIFLLIPLNYHIPAATGPLQRSLLFTPSVVAVWGPLYYFYLILTFVFFIQ